MTKHYVEVICHIGTGGHITPQRIIWHDGRSWEIGCVLQELADPFKEYSGIRYTVLIGSAVKSIYLDHGRWYVMSDN